MKYGRTPRWLVVPHANDVLCTNIVLPCESRATCAAHFVRWASRRMATLLAETSKPSLQGRGGACTGVGCSRWIRAALGLLLGLPLLTVFQPVAWATTKGLNQIPTPDVQPTGVLSISFQQVQPQIDNASQFQLEYGITKRLEVASVHGFSPKEDRLGAEWGLLQREPYLLSVGFLNWSSRTHSPQSFVEAGYYQGKEQFMAGAMRVGSRTEPIVG